MAARKETNKYYPIDWEPSMGSHTQFTGYHPLRERAARLATEGILVVRFETPFPLWCLGCDTHIARAVRFNADKRQVGSHLTTPIWEFSMTCHKCGHPFAMRTDPAAADYLCVHGVRRKQEGWEPTGDEGLGPAELLALRDPRAREGHRERMQTDPLYAAEVRARDRVRGDTAAGRVAALLPAATAAARDDVALSQLMRAHARARRHRDDDAERQRRARALTGFTLPLGGDSDNHGDGDGGARVLIAAGAIEAGAAGSLAEQRLARVLPPQTQPPAHALVTSSVAVAGPAGGVKRPRIAVAVKAVKPKAAVAPAVAAVAEPTPSTATSVNSSGGMGVNANAGAVADDVVDDGRNCEVKVELQVPVEVRGVKPRSDDVDVKPLILDIKLLAPPLSVQLPGPQPVDPPLAPALPSALTQAMAPAPALAQAPAPAPAQMLAPAPTAPTTPPAPPAAAADADRVSELRRRLQAARAQPPS
jgi:coiled-coil domain-containing protein 130